MLSRALPNVRSLARTTRHASTIRHFSRTATQSATVQFRVNGTGTSFAQTVTTNDAFPTQTIKADAPSGFGGSDSAPTPLHYTLAALSSCTQVTGNIVAREHKIQVEKWDVDVQAEFDTAVMTEGKDDNPNWKSIKLVIGVKADEAAVKALSSLADEVERRCPVAQLFKRSGVDWSSEWKQI